MNTTPNTPPASVTQPTSVASERIVRLSDIVDATWGAGVQPIGTESAKLFQTVRNLFTSPWNLKGPAPAAILLDLTDEDYDDWITATVVAALMWTAPAFGILSPATAPGTRLWLYQGLEAPINALVGQGYVEPMMASGMSASDAATRSTNQTQPAASGSCGTPGHSH